MNQLTTTTVHTAVHTAVIGGGLAGLTAAATLARAGKSVLLLEKARLIGGRAISQQRGDFTLNLGPHALYIGGGASDILAELGVAWTGHKPNLRGTAVYQNHLVPMPGAPQDLLATNWLTLAEKAAMMRLLWRISQTSPESVAGISLADWINGQTPSMPLRHFLHLLARTSTYANAPEISSADIFLHQFQLAYRHNVRYLDGGWQTLVDGLRAAAETAGVTIHTGARVMSVHEHPGHATIFLADGQTIQATAVILAVDPQTASQLLPEHTQLRQWAATAVPVRAACLDVVLRRVPHPDRRYVLGLDQPLYFSNHSAVARFGPDGGSVIHVAKYLTPGAADAAQDEAELEAMLDLVQPGWRAELLARRFLPHMTVVNDLARAENGGLHGRPGYALPHSQRLYLAGDWVGPQGWLADAALSSGKQAAELALEERLEMGELEMGAISNL
ncbi:MAG: NAD(P)/FAD-dependent oxidoreductase [Anaerolineae bacterium]|nr:NAD(P)/FAD-dependent oxidoreductase [Anaerolineae bacterium]